MRPSNTSNIEIDPGQIRRNRIFFNKYTALRRQCAYDLSSEKASAAFEIIPVLLSLNEPGLPGFIRGGGKDCGIYGMSSSGSMKRLVEEYFPETRSRDISYQKYLIKRPMIESLFLIGSIGTTAQTERSDFDYWVCVDGSLFQDESLERLRGKTLEIGRWCERTLGMEAHFFVSDLERVRRNDFGSVDEESTGSSQKQFLKEECYRTMLLVAGKIPLWWVLPPGIDGRVYDHCRDAMLRDDSCDFNDIIDLGFLGDISRREFLGTALWHLSKGIKDPFKALLKMGMMEWYLSDGFQGRLLCDLIKGRVLSGSENLMEVDPYLLLSETVLDFYETRDRQEDAELMRRAFYLKADPRITRLRLKKGRGDHKIEVFRSLMEKWGWAPELVEELNQIENWSYASHLKFSSEINKFFFSTYRRLSELPSMRGKQAIDDIDLNVLARKIFTLFSRQKNKLNLTPFLTGKRLILDRCLFQYKPARSGGGRWVLYDTTRYSLEKTRKNHVIFSSDRVVRTAAWLVVNGIYDYYRTAVEMASNPSGVALGELTDLLKHIQGVFPPALYRITGGSGPEGESGYDQIMVVIDMEEKGRGKIPVTVDLVYSNTWGEMFTETYPYQEGLAVVRGYARGLSILDAHEITSRIRVHVPNYGRGADQKRLVYENLLDGLFG